MLLTVIYYEEKVKALCQSLLGLCYASSKPFIFCVWVYSLRALVLVCKKKKCFEFMCSVCLLFDLAFLSVHHFEDIVYFVFIFVFIKQRLYG